MTWRGLAWRTLTGLAAAGLAGCGVGEALAPSIQEPRVEVAALKLVEQTAQGARIEVTLKLQNPNPTPLPLVFTSYSVVVAGGGRFEFSDQSNRTLPAGGAQTLLLPAAVACDGGGLRGSAVTVSGSVGYDPPGMIRRVLTESEFPRPTVSFQHTGNLE